MKDIVVTVCIIGALFSNWSINEKILFGATMGVSYLDYRQTQSLESLGREELNPILGKHPSKGEISNYFLLSAATKYLVADQVGHKWRSKVLWLILFVETSVVSRNVSIGVTWK